MVKKFHSLPVKDVATLDHLVERGEGTPLERDGVYAKSKYHKSRFCQMLLMRLSGKLFEKENLECSPLGEPFIGDNFALSISPSGMVDLQL